MHFLILCKLVIQDLKHRNRKIYSYDLKTESSLALVVLILVELLLVLGLIYRKTVTV